jgi:hypothetical protein
MLPLPRLRLPASRACQSSTSHWLLCTDLLSRAICQRSARRSRSECSKLRLAAFCFITCAAGFAVPAKAAPSLAPTLFGDPASSVRSVRGLRLPLGPDSAAPSAYLRCDRYAMERRQVGVFRMGLLPQPVLTGVTLELLRPPRGAPWATHLRDFLQREPALRHVLIRDFAVHGADGAVRLRARTAQPASGYRQLHLSRVSHPDQNGEYRQAAKAVLHLDGPSAGVLQLTNDAGQSIKIAY